MHGRCRAHAVRASCAPRERQVFGELLKGRLNKQIAADLGTVERTIKVHRARVMFKLGIRSIPQRVTLAQRIGFLEPMSLARVPKQV